MLALIAALALAPARAADSPQDLIRQGDAHYEQRTSTAPRIEANLTETEAAISAYRQALSAEPDSMAARWRLMRALHFKGEYAETDTAKRKLLFEEGRRIGEDTLDVMRRLASKKSSEDLSRAGPVEIAPFFKGDSDAAGCILWAAVDWGKWALAYGKLQAARKGVGGKIRDLATAVTLIDPNYEGGAGYRVLGRLHHQTPFVPFVTGWASNKEAVRFLRLAYQIDPKQHNNRLFLAEALWDTDKSARPEALKILRELATETPSLEEPLEDARAMEDAKADLAKWKVSSN